jgi:hypothetical protein
LAETESPVEDPVVPSNPPPASAAIGTMGRVVTVEVMRRTDAQCAIFGTNGMGDIVSEEVIADRCRPTSQP